MSQLEIARERLGFSRNGNFDGKRIKEIREIGNRQRAREARRLGRRDGGNELGRPCNMEDLREGNAAWSGIDYPLQQALRVVNPVSRSAFKRALENSLK